MSKVICAGDFSLDDAPQLGRPVEVDCHQIETLTETNQFYNTWETGTGAERTSVAVPGPRLAECGMNRAGSLTTSRPCGPTFAHR